MQIKEHNRTNLHSMRNWPSFPKRCPSSGKNCSHSCVHSFEPSLHLPVHSELPQGLRTTTKRFSLHSTARRTEYEWPPIRPCTFTPIIPLRSLFKSLKEHPKRRSLFAKASSFSQNTSMSRISLLWRTVDTPLINVFERLT